MNSEILFATIAVGSLGIAALQSLASYFKPAEPTMLERAVVGGRRRKVRASKK